MQPDDTSESDRPGDDVDELLAAAYALDGPEASRALYARWAATYDSGWVTDSGYVYPDHVARVFVEHAGPLGTDDAVVDVGCGTGLAGVSLRRRGVEVVDGLDISPEMLEQAAAKELDGHRAYRHLLEADLTATVPVADHSYAGALSTGTFTHGHVGPAALGEVLRILRPGATAAIGVNAAHFASANFASAFEALVGEGRIGDVRLVDVAIYEGADMADPDQYAHVAVFTVLR